MDGIERERKYLPADSWIDAQPFRKLAKNISSTKKLAESFQKHEVEKMSIHNESITYRTEEITYYPPILNPPSFRDFFAFEQHAKTSRSLHNLETISEWYEFPVFYFSNPNAFLGHKMLLKKPLYTEELDYELEMACIIGKEGCDIPIDEAPDYIAGYCILNDWSARDIQRREMRVGLGPAKGGTLYPGDVFGSRTVGTGCILELRPENTEGWLKSGDIIELEIEKLGTLRTEIIES